MTYLTQNFFAFIKICELRNSELKNKEKKTKALVI